MKTIILLALLLSPLRSHSTVWKLKTYDFISMEEKTYKIPENKEFNKKINSWNCKYSKVWTTKSSPDLESRSMTCTKKDTVELILSCSIPNKSKGVSGGAYSNNVKLFDKKKETSLILSCDSRK